MGSTAEKTIDFILESTEKEYIQLFNQIFMKQQQN